MNMNLFTEVITKLKDSDPKAYEALVLNVRLVKLHLIETDNQKE